jgi:hypothetical protein
MLFVKGSGREITVCERLDRWTMDPWSEFDGEIGDWLLDVVCLSECGCGNWCGARVIGK